MREYVFGAHILESLTTGMYQDSRMIFREYIQNACDSIDKAVREGVLEPDEGRIEIELDHEGRNITITDNAMGIRADDFERVMGNIADSDKRIGEDRGFRGIGRLCGLAYCETVIFTAKFAGEDVVSRLTCNAGVLKGLLDDRNSGINRYTASQVLNFVNEFSSEHTDETEAHYFKIELLKINKVNTDLLDYGRVKRYLSFTAPLPYSFTFDPFGARIEGYAENLGQSIDEYSIFLNDEQLFKDYTIRFNTGRGKGEDEVFDLKFDEFRDISDNVIAWMWYGVSSFRGAIEEKCPMRGIRIRKENIQIGDEDTLRRFFGEQRGNSYFIGELFCVSDDLIPNSRRDYFSENPLRAELEKQLKIHFRELSKLYHDGSVINSAMSRYNAAEKKKSELSGKLTRGELTTPEEKREVREKLNEAEDESAKAQKEIDRLRYSGSSTTINIIDRIESRNSGVIEAPARTYTQKERRLIGKIFEVIRSALDEDTASELISRIEESLK